VVGLSKICRFSEDNLLWKTVCGVKHASMNNNQWSVGRQNKLPHYRQFHLQWIFWTFTLPSWGTEDNSQAAGIEIPYLFWNLMIHSYKDPCESSEFPRIMFTVDRCQYFAAIFTKHQTIIWNICTQVWMYRVKCGTRRLWSAECFLPVNDSIYSMDMWTGSCML
jgi:hypothetical protein